MGAHTAEIALTADVPADVVPLRVVGLDVSVQWSAAIMDFGPWAVGQTAQRMTAWIRNTGNTPIVVTQIDVAGEFLVQDTIPTFPEIRPNYEKILWVWFRPVTVGAQQGSITVHTASHGAMPPLPLAGVGV